MNEYSRLTGVPIANIVSPTNTSSLLPISATAITLSFGILTTATSAYSSLPTSSPVTSVSLDNTIFILLAPSTTW